MDPRQNKEMVVFILKAGANPNYTNKGGYTAMDIAKWVGKQGFQRIGQAPVRG
jgi:ankyrin repeat protein